MFISDIRQSFVNRHGRRKGGRGALGIEIFSKKGCVLSFEWEKSNFATFAPPWKNLEKIP